MNAKSCVPKWLLLPSTSRPAIYADDHPHHQLVHRVLLQQDKPLNPMTQKSSAQAPAVRWVLVHDEVQVHEQK